MTKNKIKTILEQEFIHGYTTFDRLFMASMLLLQIVVFIIVPDSWLSIVCGISGVISTVLCAKGKISFYFIGFIQTITYLILAWQNWLVGECIEQIFYLVTMIWGIFLWKKNLKVDENNAAYVEVKKFSLLMWIVSVFCTIVGTLLTGYCLTLVNSNQPYLDASTNVIAVFAQFMMIKGYREQWMWWMVLNCIMIVIWGRVGNWTMVAMYIAWLLNCGYAWYNWTQLHRTQKYSQEMN